MAGNLIDHTGETVGSFYLAEKLEQKDNTGNALYKGVCVFCGAEFARRYSTFLASKNSNRCRCKTHLVRREWENARLRGIFHDMKRRCYDPRRPDYKNWGGKGIKICDEWLKDPGNFERWAFENGYTDNLTIDRIDGNKDYCPENCRWITRAENASKKSTTIYIEVDGVTLNLSEWARKLEMLESHFQYYNKKYGTKKTKEHIRELLSKQTPNQPNS